MIRRGTKKRAKSTKHQRKYRTRRRKTQRIAEHVEEETSDIVEANWKVRRSTNIILWQIEKTLVAFPSILTKVLVMRNVLDDPIVRDVIPNPIGLTKDALVQRKLLSWVVQSLFEVKR